MCIRDSLLTSHPRTTCTDPIAICGMPCDKLLPCGKHKCSNTCHVGACPPCSFPTEQSCRCGNTKRKVDCCLVTYAPKLLRRFGLEPAEFLCKKRCESFKKCNKHKCGRICCDVGRKYGGRAQDDPEGHHLCHLVCDKPLGCGKHQCPDFCHLGFCKPCAVVSSRLLLCACGKSVKQPPVACGESLPYCSRPCSKLLPCGHKCASNCHPGECPPCIELVEKKCRCGKELIKNVQCFKTNLSCGNKCNKELKCGHVCSLVCHEPGKCLRENEANGSCGQRCGKPKQYCAHICQETCHPAKSCPTTPCTSTVTVYCACKHHKEVVQCGAFDKPVAYAVPCNRQCERARRKAELERPVNEFDYYPRSMLWLGHHDPGLVAKIESVLEDVVLDMNKLGVQLPNIDPDVKDIIIEWVQYNYYLDIIPCKKGKETYYEVYFNEKARLPKLKLSEAAKSYKKKSEMTGEEKLPFKATILLQGDRRTSNIEQVKPILAKFIYKYYIEKCKGSGYYLHFYDKKVAESAYELLRTSAHSFSSMKLLMEEKEEEHEKIEEVAKDDDGFEYA
eukprot:TRINITY_DN8171_c0_g3_i1.p1 TRINITY_DN8171_c0_g3~~TRINITY_DN8171_c0_g3_i1.p1  ORF type:complete len:560 (+),score=91.19 TRINITY_DN8171_c0_g3_i1:64-1743(+)